MSESGSKVMENLKLKLEYSLKYGEALDRQLNALMSGDADKLAEYINIMDEYHAKLTDLDRLLKNDGIYSPTDDYLSSPPPETESDTKDIYFKIKLACQENIEKIKRNREVLVSKRDEVLSRMQELTKSVSVKNYFKKTQSGEFFSFSG